MVIESLTSVELVQGFIEITQLTLNFVLGIRIIMKYINIKRFELITIGGMTIFLTSAWWGSGLSFLSILFFDVPLSENIYIIISYGLIPVASLLWMYSFGLLVYPHYRWKIFFVYLTFNLVYVGIFFYYLYVDPSLLVLRISKFDSETQIVVTSFIIITLIISLATNFIFMRKSLKSEQPKIRYKGIFIFCALVTFVVGAVLDSIFSLTPITVVITRSILMISSILQYIGWIMPEGIAKILIKE